ncbi:MAG: vitamin K epoxide reductase family protein [Olleya sp.]
MNHPLINLLLTFLERNKIFLDKKEFEFQIQSHPNYPSLNSITGVLTHFKIDNIAAEVPVNIDTVKQLPNIYLAEINGDMGNELAIVECKQSEYKITSKTQKGKSISENEFLKIFTGIILAIDNDNYQEVLTKPKYSILNYVLPILIGLVVIFMHEVTVLKFLFFILSIVGILISGAILKQEFGLETTIGNAFCSSTNEKKDCSAVLSSKGANLFKNLKLSDFSLIYFLSLGFSSFIFILNETSHNTIYTISILSLPITVYSIYYQLRILKKWCMLCLCIVGVLWLQGIVAFFDFSLDFLFKNIILLILVFTTVFIIWNNAKPKIFEFLRTKKEEISFMRFKRNFTLFITLLFSSKKIDTQIEEISEIIFGNKSSELELLIVTNPYCGHCKVAHDMIEDLINKYNDNVKLIIRFNVDTDDLNNDLVNITTRLHELYYKNSPEDCIRAMNSIYNGKPTNEWLEEWGYCNDKDVYIQSLKKQALWCSETNINFTPEILVNGRSFPSEYNRSDLVYFIAELEENALAKQEI